MTLQVKMFSKALCSLALIWYHALSQHFWDFLASFVQNACWGLLLSVLVYK